jgi:protein-L-isoaspartate(D-aspartate) O-methyltransferase
MRRTDVIAARSFALRASIFLASLVIVASCAGREAQPGSQDWNAERRRMVETQLRGRDIRHPRVLDIMGTVPRHLFVAEPERDRAYSDTPLPIGHGQTISQPYIVAFMTQELAIEPGHRVLEIGTGSGYQAAVLGALAKEVYTIEIVAPLAQRADQILKSLGYRNINVRTGNGYLGWPEHAPYDRIMVTAAPDEVPAALVQQLKVGGLMAIPVGTGVQELRILRRTPTGMETLRTLPVRFVPMTGKPRAQGRSFGTEEFLNELSLFMSVRDAPPSTIIACPVMKRLSDEQGKTNVPMRSSDDCKRLIDLFFNCKSINALGAFRPSCSIKPGAMALTQMNSPTSRANERVMAMSTALEATQSTQAFPGWRWVTINSATYVETSRRIITCRANSIIVSGLRRGIF